MEAAPAERAELHLAAVDVFRSYFGEDPGADGENLYRQAVQDQSPQGTDRFAQATLLAIPARRQRRPAGGIHSSLQTSTRDRSGPACNGIALIIICLPRGGSPGASLHAKSGAPARWCV